MTDDVHLATVLHADGTAGRFVVLQTSHEEVVIYSHWKVFKDAGFTSVQPGQKFEIQIEPDRKDDQTPIVSRVLKLIDDSIIQVERVDGNEEEQILHLSANKLRCELCDSHDDLVIVRKMKIEEFEARNLSLSVSVVFIDCCFEGNYRLLDSSIHGSIWFLNCTFRFHFSLRGTCLDGNAVLFGCDFRGSGGISFRGLQGRSIYLEYGTRGSEDMLWLNELSLSGCVAINGIFAMRVEMLAQQDDNPVNSDPKLHRVLIGKRDYTHESLSENQFLGGIECRGYQFQGSFEVHNSIVSDLMLDQVDANHISVDKCEISRDVVLNCIQPRDEKKGIVIANSVIERHLRLTACYLRGCLDLSYTSVGQMWTLELSTPNSGVPRVRLDHFYAGTARFEPVELIYGAICQRRLLTPPVFQFLEGAERSGMLTGERRRALAEAYTSCKNWLATSGHLLEEDHAFFHMQNTRESRLLKRYLFGGIFGWGIHLWNILLSAIGLIAFFAILYTSIGAGAFLDMIILSAQSFISSFFGQWPEYSPVGILSILITLESMLGVIFITILVGAYIRKLLR